MIGSKENGTTQSKLENASLADLIRFFNSPQVSEDKDVVVTIPMIQNKMREEITNLNQRFQLLDNGLPSSYYLNKTRQQVSMLQVKDGDIDRGIESLTNSKLENDDVVYKIKELEAALILCENYLNYMERYKSYFEIKLFKDLKDAKAGESFKKTHPTKVQQFKVFIIESLDANSSELNIRKIFDSESFPNLTPDDDKTITVKAAEILEQFNYLS